MGHILTVESDEAFALATQLAALTGESLEVVMIKALRAALAREEFRRESTERSNEGGAFYTKLSERPSSIDQNTGLPI